jgi:GNAT superfamily N-acetyltransferase
MIFEDQYEPELQSLAADKDYILDRGLAAWMYVDGQLAGETFGLFVADDDEVLIDLEDRPGGDFYVYSTTILPQYRGRGYGRILKAYFLGYLRGQFEWFRLKFPTGVIIGHATSPAMLKINKEFGAVVLAEHRNWYGTPRTAWFYEIRPKT